MWSLVAWCSYKVSLKFITWFKSYLGGHTWTKHLPHARLSFLNTRLWYWDKQGTCLETRCRSRESNRLKFIFVHVWGRKSLHQSARIYIYLQLVYRLTDQRMCIITIRQIHTGLHAGGHDWVSTQHVTSLCNQYVQPNVWRSLIFWKYRISLIQPSANSTQLQTAFKISLLPTGCKSV
jgi:hypothetical protein